MKVKEHIPQSLTINQTKTTINVNYQNQPTPCNISGYSGHRARRCTVDPVDYKCLVDIELPDTNDENIGNDANDEELIVYTDININPSQESKSFKCILCDYTCKYDHILSEHMEAHTGEKTL